MLDSAFCGGEEGAGACEGGGGAPPPGTNAEADADGFHSPALGFILSMMCVGGKVGGRSVRSVYVV